MRWTFRETAVTEKHDGCDETATDRVCFFRMQSNVNAGSNARAHGTSRAVIVPMSELSQSSGELVGVKV
jgi:hypothetical protein